MKIGMKKSFDRNDVFLLDHARNGDAEAGPVLCRSWQISSEWGEEKWELHVNVNAGWSISSYT